MNKDRDMNIVVLPGDGAGPEVSAEAVKCLELLSDHCGLDLRFETLDFGCAAIDTAGPPLPGNTLPGLKCADAVLLGCVVGALLDGRPEMSAVWSCLCLLASGLFVYLLQARLIPGTAGCCPRRRDSAGRS